MKTKYEFWIGIGYEDGTTSGKSYKIEERRNARQFFNRRKIGSFYNGKQIAATSFCRVKIG